VSSSSPRVKDQDQAAQQLGVSARTLQRWEKTAAWWPKGARTRAGYKVAAIAAAKPKSEIGDDDETPLRAAARQAEHVKTIEEGKRAKIRRQTEELKLRVQEGELLPRLGIEQSFADILTGIADWCEQLPDVLVSMCEVPQKYHRGLRRLLKQLIEQKQHELADELEAKALTRDKDQTTDHG
jgi:hypothetical protein